MLAFALVGCTNQTSEISGYIYYEEQGGFSYLVPDGWLIEPAPRFKMLVYRGQSTVVTVTYDIVNKTGSLQEMRDLAIQQAVKRNALLRQSSEVEQHAGFERTSFVLELKTSSGVSTFEIHMLAQDNFVLITTIGRTGERDEKVEREIAAIVESVRWGP